MAAGKKFLLGVCQILSGPDKAKNLENAAQAIKKVVSEGAQVVCLPECFNSPYATDKFREYSESIPGQTSSFLVESAKKHNVYIVGGSFPEIEEDKVYNTCLVISPEGNIVAKHRKVHLFDIDVPGKITFKESDTLSPGNTVTLFDTPWCKIGVGICYDIRFPELAMAMRESGASVLLYPGAFNMTTGPLHWELLQRARALDNQCFVAAVSPARGTEGYIAWGHSTVVDPWGKVLNKLDEKEGTAIQEIDLETVEGVRENIPVSKQKRPDVYTSFQ